MRRQRGANDFRDTFLEATESSPHCSWEVQLMDASMGAGKKVCLVKKRWQMYIYCTYCSCFFVYICVFFFLFGEFEGGDIIQNPW